MVEKSGQNTAPSGRAAGGEMGRWAAQLAYAVADAQAALASGDPASAEQQARAICACAKAVREVAELRAAAREEAPEEDVENIRAEVRRRLARFVVAEQGGASLEQLERIAVEGDAP